MTYVLWYQSDRTKIVFETFNSSVSSQYNDAVTHNDLQTLFWTFCCTGVCGAACLISMQIAVALSLQSDVTLENMN